MVGSLVGCDVRFGVRPGVGSFIVVDKAMIQIGVDAGRILMGEHPVTRFNNNSNLSARALVSLSYLSSRWAQYSCSHALSATYFASRTNSFSSCCTLSAS